MTKIHSVEGEEIIQIHQDLIRITNGLEGIIRPGHENYICDFAYLAGDNLIDQGAYYLSRLVKDHMFNDGNKRTAYFATKFFLMKNYHDLNGESIDESVDEMESLAKAKNIEASQKLAKELLKRDILSVNYRVNDYQDFYRLVIKSIGVAHRLSKM